MKLFRVLILTVLAFAVGRNAYSQDPVSKDFSATKQLATKMKGTKLIVIVDENNIIDKYLQESIEKFWTITPYEFGTAAKVPHYTSSSKNSVLAYAAIEYEEENVKSRGKGYGIYLGGTQIDSIQYAPIVDFAAATRYWEFSKGVVKYGINTEDEDARFYSPFLVLQLQYRIKQAYEDKIPERNIYDDTRTCYYGYGKYFLESKTIYVSDELMDEAALVKFAGNLELPRERFVLNNMRQMKEKLYEQDKNTAFIYLGFNNLFTVYDFEGKALATASTIPGEQLNAAEKKKEKRENWKYIGGLLLITGILTGLGYLLDM